MSEILKKIFVVLLLFFVVKVMSQMCLQPHTLSFPLLQHLDGKHHDTCPVPISKNQVRCIIVPSSDDHHAQCLMAATYKSLQEQEFDTIIVMCGADSVMFHGVALPIFDIDFCPEKLQLSYAALEKLSKNEHFHYYQLPFCCNCAMSQQLKCITLYLKNTKIIPIIIGKISQQDASDIALVLAHCATHQTLIIMSANVGKYQHCVHNCPIDVSKICAVYDQDACRIQAVQSGTFEHPMHLFDDQDTSVFAVFFELLRLSQFENIESLCVGYTTSSCGYYSMEDVSTYGAFILQDGLFGYKNRIGLYEQSQLLQCARVGLRELFNAPVRRLPCMISYEMLQPSGVFASLYRMSDHGPALQGCMGKVQAKIPLYKMTYQMSQQAACRDVRFYPLRHKDVDNTIISLSVVRDFKKIGSYNEICHADGLMLQYDDKKAIFLPEPCLADSWSCESALIDLSRKIGKHDFTWRKPRAKIFKFSTIVFQEE